MLTPLLLHNDNSFPSGQPASKVHGRVELAYLAFLSLITMTGQRWKQHNLIQGVQDGPRWSIGAQEVHILLHKQAVSASLRESYVPRIIDNPGVSMILDLPLKKKRKKKQQPQKSWFILSDYSGKVKTSP